MAANKFFKSLLSTFTIAISLFGFSVENSFAYPVFAQQGYSNPRAANGKLACANCHLNPLGKIRIPPTFKSAGLPSALIC